MWVQSSPTITAKIANRHKDDNAVKLCNLAATSKRKSVLDSVKRVPKSKQKTKKQKAPLMKKTLKMFHKLNGRYLA